VADHPDTGTYTCQEVARRATEFIENRLGADAKAAMERHLVSCPDCRNYVQQLTLVRDSLRQRSDPPMPDKTRASLTQRFVRAMRDNKKS